MNVIDNDPLALTPKDVSALTGLSIPLVMSLSDEGVIRCLRIPRNAKETVRKYRRSWVDEFINKHTTKPQPA